MQVHQLSQIVPPPNKPVETGSPKQWQLVQNRLGTPLPEDYKTFIDTYGTGAFNDFLLPYTPFSTLEEVNTFLVLDTHHHTNNLIQTKTSRTWSAVKPFDFYPCTNGLLPWGTTSRMAQSFFWQVSGPPNTWPTVLYTLKTGEYEVWKMPFSVFILKLITREIKSVLLPDKFPPQDTPIRYNQRHTPVF
jgi:hypothetical protein